MLHTDAEGFKFLKLRREKDVLIDVINQCLDEYQHHTDTDTDGDVYAGSQTWRGTASLLCQARLSLAAVEAELNNMKSEYTDNGQSLELFYYSNVMKWGARK